MKIKTSELTGAALDWAVARLEFPEHSSYDLEVWVTPLPCDDPEDFKYQPSTDWAQGGPIIDKNRIGVEPWGADAQWLAQTYNAAGRVIFRQYGPTPLIAAMRCYVASKLGDEVEVPDELA